MRMVSLRIFRIAIGRIYFGMKSGCFFTTFKAVLRYTILSLGILSKRKIIKPLLWMILEETKDLNG
jgi:hypothetical protein